MKYNWKTKKKTFLGFILQDNTPLKSQKREKLLFWGYFGGLGTNGEFNDFYDFVNFWSFSLYLLVRNSFNFKLGFFTYFEYISVGIIRKDILCSYYYSARWYWRKKGQKNLLQTSHNFFSMLGCEFLIVMSISVQNICKNSFSGGKSRKNGIPVIKITFLKKILQKYRFPWVNTKTIRYTCRFDIL